MQLPPRCQVGEPPRGSQQCLQGARDAHEAKPEGPSHPAQDAPGAEPAPCSGQAEEPPFAIDRLAGAAPTRTRHLIQLMDTGPLLRSELANCCPGSSLG